MKSAIRAQNLNKSFKQPDGRSKYLFKDLTLNVSEGEFLVVIGPSGCGKTTLLNMFSGIDRDYEGRILLNSAGSRTQQDQIGLGRVFQEPRLLPWRTVFENLKLVLDEQKSDKVGCDDRIGEYLKMVQLWEYRNHYPNQLSGGMQQRVALARAFVIEPCLLLMDEPLGSLDESLSSKLELEILRLWQYSKKTVVLVTHNIMEALRVADRIVFLSPHTLNISREWNISKPRPREMSETWFYNLYLQIRKEFEKDSESIFIESNKPPGIKTGNL
ncbi:MAG: ABC transporter ATP-binding protein [Proteobacteria bacterium]|nr:ABC transporter ATP-binding protein [Pseudomonadota bacterium]